MHTNTSKFKLFFVGWFSILFTIANAQNIQFTDISKSAGVRGYKEGNKYVFGHGVAFADISGDSLPDIYVSNAVRDKNVPELLYISVAGEAYLEQADERGVADQFGYTGSHGIVFVDVDNDGDYDIFNGSTDERNHLYLNNGSGYFDDITNQAGIDNVKLGTRGVVAFDANGDGYMDLYAVNWNKDYQKDRNELYINNGDGTFSREDRHATRINEDGIGVQGVTAVDVENDGDLDIYISRRPYPDKSKTARNQLLINDGTGDFSEQAYERGISDGGRAGNGATFADYDNDGDLDAFVVSTRKNWFNSAPYLGLFRNRGDGYFDDLTEEVKIRHDGFSAILFDVDNDGDLDYFALRCEHDEPCALYLNDGHGNFSQATDTGLEIATRDARGAGVADIDNDGDLDLYFACKNYEDEQPASDGRNYLLRNDTQNNNRWLKIFVRGPKGDMGGFGTKIWIFESGHLDDLNHLIGFKQVTNAYGYLCQDDPIQHFGLGQRDECDVKVQMLDGTTLVLPNTQARQLVYFSKPHQITKTSGDGQEANPSTILPEPFVITVENEYGEPVPGAAISFEIVSGGGQLSTEDVVYTDLKGQASVTLTLGPGNGENVVRASIAGMDVLPVEFTAFAIGSRPVELVEIDGNGQTGQVGTALGDSMQVRIVDENDQGVSNYQVNFTIIAGGGRLNANADTSLDVFTNESGYAAVSWTLGTDVAQPQQLQAVVFFQDSHITNSPLLFEATAIAGPAFQFVKVSGDSQIGTVGEDLLKELVVALKDSFDNPIPNEPIHFEVISGGGSVNGQMETTVNTNEEGLAAVIWQLGTVAGDSHTVQVSYSGLPDLIFASTTQPGPPNSISVVNGTEFIGVVGQPLEEPLCVFISDQFGNPIEGYKVHFEITGGNGSIGSNEFDVYTNASGKACCQWTLGTAAGTNNNVVEVTLENQTLPVLTFTASARPEHPKTLSQISGDGQTGYINARLSQPLVVAVSDTFGNAVSDHSVTFEVIQGRGTFDGETILSVETDSLGQASAFLTLGTDPEDNRIRVTGQWQGGVLDGSPVEFTATAEHRPIDVHLSSISAASPIAANGSDKATITVSLKDELESPIQGITVTLGVSGSGATLHQPESPTDQDGKTVGYLSSTELGLKKVWALVGDTLAVVDSAQVFFVPGNAFRLQKAAGDSQTVVVGRQVPEPVVVAVTDSLGFPIADYPVDFLVTAGGGTPQEPVTVSTNDNGEAAFSAWIVGAKPGLNHLQAGAEGLENSPVIFAAQGILGTPTSIKVVSGNNQSAHANARLTDPLQMMVKDLEDNPLPGIDVWFSVQSGGGQIVEPQPVLSNDQGVAQAYWILGSEGPQVAIAIVEGVADTATFSALISENQAPVLSLPQDTTGFEMQELSFAVKAVDPEGDSLVISAQDIPEGAAFNSEEAIFSWLPSYEQAGDYKVIFLAQDEFGASDRDTLRIHIINVNRLPVILSYQPIDTLIEAFYRVPIDFGFTAADPDGDSLSGSWLVNDVTVSTQETFTLIPNPTLPSRTFVALLVKDNEDTTSLTWRVDIIDGVDSEDHVPTKIGLAQNYPNPFNPVTTISFALPGRQHVSITISNIYGQIIYQLIDNYFAPGYHTITWHGTDQNNNPVSSGVYYYQMIAEGFTQTRKLLLLR